MKIQKSKGISLYIAFMVMTVLLVIGFGISSLLVSQIKTLRQRGNSVVAYYAAETGIERELYERNPQGTQYADTLGGATYEVWVIEAGSGTCPSGVNYCVKSVGFYKETKRAIQVIR